MGNIYANQRNFKLAAESYRQSLVIDGGNYDAFFDLVYADLVLGDYPSAEGWSETELKSFPNHEDMRLFLAVAEYNTGKKEQALKDATEANSALNSPQSNYIYTQIMNNQQIILQQ